MIENAELHYSARRPFSIRLAGQRQRLVQDSLGMVAIPSTSGDFHVWLSPPEGWRADVFSCEFARLGVRVSEARSLAMNTIDTPDAIRLCVSHEANEERLQRGLEIVAGVLL